MKIKKYKVISHYQETNKTKKEVLSKYFAFYIKNKIFSMSDMIE